MKQYANNSQITPSGLPNSALPLPGKEIAKENATTALGCELNNLTADFNVRAGVAPTLNPLNSAGLTQTNLGVLNGQDSMLGRRNARRRPTTAGQLLDNLAELNEQTDEPSSRDSVFTESDRSKEAEAGYVCPQRGCHKTFSRKLRLNAHLHLHYGTQPYKCTFPTCGKAFSEKQNLRIHMRIHVDERPFQCPQGCGKSFRTKGNMRDHERRHFGDK